MAAVINETKIKIHVTAIIFSLAHLHCNIRHAPRILDTLTIVVFML